MRDGVPMLTAGPDPRPILRCVIFILLMTSACATERLDLEHPGRLSALTVARIVKGRTTKAEVVEKFGKPFDSVVMKDGDKFFYKDFNLRALYIEFNEHGVVQSYTYDE
jgi:hypothetical protein